MSAPVAGSAPRVLRWSAKSKVFHYDGPEFGGELLGSVPQFPAQLLADLREIAVGFSNGACLLFKGDAIWEFRVLPGADHVVEGGQEPIGEELVLAPVTGDVHEDVDQAGGDHAIAGNGQVLGHDGSFVLALLPLAEAYARFPEIAPTDVQRTVAEAV